MDVDLVLVDTRSGKRRAIVLGPEPIVLGSGVDCDVVVPSPEVPERALQASASPDGIVLESLSRFRFTLNEKPALGAILHPGDVVKLGPFQLVAAGGAPAVDRDAEREAAAVAAPADAAAVEHAPPAPSEEEIAVRAEREAFFAERRRRRQRQEVAFGTLLLLLVGGGAFWLWRSGAFERAAKTDASTGDRIDGLDGALDSRGFNATPELPPTRQPGGEGPAEEETEESPDPGWRKPSPPEEVAETLAKVEKLLALEEFARCRWLLWQLSPTTEEDRSRVEARRREIDAAARKAGDEHLRFVDELVKKGKLAAALSHCEEESIERFRGLETWYRLLEKADEIEAILDERVPETLRAKSTRKHARPMPKDLDTRPPPPVRVSLSEEMGATDLPAARSSPREAAPRPAHDGAAPDPNPAPAPPTPEQLAAQAAVAAALAELAAAKPAAFETVAKNVVEAARGAKEMAAAPLLARCEELATALEQAPERESLAELRRRVQALGEARAAALAFLFDEQRYFMLDPKAPADVNRGDELAKAQKEADRRVDSVRKVWGSELGGAPAPLVALSDAYSKLVREARLIDGLLGGLGHDLPDRSELLGTRLLPLWAPKVSVRNYALDLDERRRIDSDRETKTRNQQVKDVKDADELELLFVTNAYREMLGRPQLEFDRRLYDQARTNAELLAAASRRLRDSDPQPDPEPRSSGPKPTAGANFLRARVSPRQALQAWCRIAAAHRNLLDPAHRSMAASHVAPVWVQLFGLLAPPK